jgi:mono/diheme cytochrome c family protein
MKNLIYFSFVALTIIITSCSGPKRKPGSVYMPDMAYSRAYESFPDLNEDVFTNQDSLAGKKIYYDRKPVNGAVKRGQLGVYHFTNDSASKAGAKFVNNPIDSLITKDDKKESVRLFNIYCAICHGVDMKGQGPLVASGKFGAAAANLVDLTKFGKGVYGDGQLFHSITYGKNAMGGYGSQLSNKQRWMVVNYIRSKQDLAIADAAPAKTDKPTTDTSKKSK